MEGEWFEGYNQSNKSINLIGLEFSSKEDRGFTVVEDVIVPANGYALFAMRRNTSLNGGLPDPDYIYISTISLKMNDWLEMRFNNRVIDRIDITDDIIAPLHLPQNKRRICISQKEYGLGENPESAQQLHSISYDYIINEVALFLHQQTIIGFSLSLSPECPKIQMRYSFRHTRITMTLFSMTCIK